MKHTWTAETAYNYVEMFKDDPNRGLKYCSALDYLNNHVSAEKLAELRQQAIEAAMPKPKKKKKKRPYDASKRPHTGRPASVTA